MKKQSGFTLIELVMVIVILGILAAVAIPKFIDLSSDAQTAAAAGAAGALSSASVMNYAARVANSTNGIDFSGAAAAVSGLTANMAVWQTANFSVDPTVACASAGAAVTVGVSHTGGGTAATATLICTG